MTGAAAPGLRTGWTTGTCASAAAKAAALGLVTGEVPDTVTVALPAGRRVDFVVETDSGSPSRAVVVKDAGDDPDCTDGARVTAEVAFAGADGRSTTPGSELRAGPGVGVVTLPGLGLPLRQAAINPVPRRMILAALAEVTAEPLVVTFSVPDGEAMATHTTNARLGIVGGISILGTTGIVRPFSTAAYRASVVQQVDVAAAQGHSRVVLATGSRTEKAAIRLNPELSPVCFVEVGDFTGIALRRAAEAGFAQAALVGMAGKITKLAAGVMMTHFHRSAVDGELMAAAVRDTGAPSTLASAATETATARHFFEACLRSGHTEPLVWLCQRARAACEAHTGGSLPTEVVMVDFDGQEVVARA